MSGKPSVALVGAPIEYFHFHLHSTFDEHVELFRCLARKVDDDPFRDVFVGGSAIRDTQFNTATAVFQVRYAHECAKRISGMRSHQRFVVVGDSARGFQTIE